MSNASLHSHLEAPQKVKFLVLYRLKCFICWHIRPQTEENWASRPLCHTQASDRQISSWVGDHQRIPAVVCFFFPLEAIFATVRRQRSKRRRIKTSHQAPSFLHHKMSPSRTPL